MKFVFFWVKKDVFSYKNLALTRTVWVKQNVYCPYLPLRVFSNVTFLQQPFDVLHVKKST